jgi:PPM family protein phosphatase
MLDFGFKSDRGKLRKENQDAFFVMPKEGIFLVSDGVGGHSFGELASRLTMTYIAGFIKENPIPDEASDEDLKDYFLSLARMANEHVHKEALDRATNGMATTLIMLYIRRDAAYVMNIGDSRAYLVRDANIMQITEDHTYVNDLVKEGVITQKEAKSHPDKNMITRAIGAEPTVKPDFYKFDIYARDVLLLCTDGLYNEVSEHAICKVLARQKNMREACTRLVDMANNNGGGDNITVVAVRV